MATSDTSKVSRTSFARLHRLGATNARLAQSFNLTLPAVRYLLEELELENHFKANAKSKREKLAAVAPRLLAEGASIREVARTAGVDKSTAHDLYGGQGWTSAQVREHNGAVAEALEDKPTYANGKLKVYS